MEAMAANIGISTGSVNGFLTGRDSLTARSFYRSMLSDTLKRIEQRLEALGLNATEASRAAGLSEDAIRNMRRAVEAGNRKGVSTKTIAGLAKALQTTDAWLLSGQGPEVALAEGVQSIPIIDWVAAGQLTDNVSQLPPESETIEISGLPPGDYFGTKARGDSMNRVAPDDSLLIVNRADRELVRGRRYIFTSRGKTTFKRFGGKDPYRLEPESWNPANEPIYPRDGETWEVIGRVTMVVAEI